MLPYNKDLKQFSKELRKNMTDAERLLWSQIRRKQLRGRQFYRQKIIKDYIVDFCCPKARLVIEIDGGQHYHGEIKKKDKTRDEAMVRMELRVLRFSDREVFKNLDGVVEKIYENL